MFFFSLAVLNNPLAGGHSRWYVIVGCIPFLDSFVQLRTEFTLRIVKQRDFSILCELAVHIIWPLRLLHRYPEVKFINRSGRVFFNRSYAKRIRQVNASYTKSVYAIQRKYGKTGKK